MAEQGHEPAAYSVRCAARSVSPRRGLADARRRRGRTAAAPPLTRPGSLEGADQSGAGGRGLEAVRSGGDHEPAEVGEGEAEVAMQVGEFLGHGRREGQRVVGTDRDPYAGFVQRADRMRRHRGRETRPHVAGGADVERDTGSHKPSLR